MKFRKSKPVNTVFIIHLYYFDMLNDLCYHLDNLRNHLDFDVIVSVPESNSLHVKTISQKLDPFMVLVTENRGRDVLPFLKVLPYVEEFKYACKIHTKTTNPKTWKGPSNHNYKNWRDLMWNSLINPEEAKKAINLLKNQTRIYAPSRLWIRRIHKGHFKNNVKNIKKLGEAVNMKLTRQPFIAGTMFWFEVDRLIWLNEYDLDYLFDPEAGSEDGKMEHAFERCFVQLARRTEF